MFSKIQLLSALGALATVSAHGHVKSWVIDGAAHAGFNPSYAADYGATAERPTDNSDQGFADHKSPMVACGGTSAGTGIQTLDIKGGSSVSAVWNTWPESHKGPIIEWMANCGGASCDGVDAASLDWFKIAEEGFVGGSWAGEKISKTLKWDFTIPSDLVSGAYLVRHEIIAMHSTGMPQVYPVCFQANLVSSGSVVPTLTTTFPEAYTINADFETWNLYGGDQTAFVAPGPGIYSGGGTAPAPAPAPSASASASVSASSAPVSSVVASSTEVVVPSASATATEEYPAEPTVSAPVDSASVPVESASAPVESASAPVESASAPVESASAPVESASAPVESAPASSASSAPAAPAPSTPATPAPAPGAGNGAMGGAAPAITESGGRFTVNGGSYNSRPDAVYASCMSQMNSCKNWANSLPNAEVGPAFTACDTQVSTCTASGRKRDVINRYSKRSLRV